MFLVSDNLLGRTIFTGFHIYDRKVNSLVIMVTYYLGQYFIVINVDRIWRNQYERKVGVEERGSLLTDSIMVPSE